MIYGIQQSTEPKNLRTTMTRWENKKVFSAKKWVQASNKKPMWVYPELSTKTIQVQRRNWHRYLRSVYQLPWDFRFSGKKKRIARAKAISTELFVRTELDLKAVKIRQIGTLIKKTNKTMEGIARRDLRRRAYHVRKQTAKGEETMEITRSKEKIEALLKQADGRGDDFARGVAMATRWIVDTMNRTPAPFETTPSDVLNEEARERDAPKASTEEPATEAADVPPVTDAEPDESPEGG